MRYSNTGYFYKSGIIVFTLIVFILIAIPGFTAEKKKKIKALNPSVQACEYIATHANNGSLQSILIKSEPDESGNIEVPEGLDGVVYKRVMDINNDGVMERVFVESQGTAHVEDFTVYKLKTDDVIEMKVTWGNDWANDKERWAADRAFIEFQDVKYILGKTDQSLQYLLYINPKNEMQVVCEFGQRENPIVHLKKSNNDNVCKKALNNELNYVEYDKLHTLSVEEVRKAGFYETHPGDKAALIDIDNDGRKELVVSLGMASGRGRGCDSTFPAVLTSDRTSIDKKYSERLPFGRCGGTVVKPFIIDGKTYLDEVQTGPYADHRQVYILDKNELKTICEFEVRPDNYVLGEAESVEKAAETKGDLWEYAVSQPGTKTVDALIKEGKHLNPAMKIQKEHNPYCFFPIGAALFFKRDDILEKLLKAGADPNLTGAKDISSNLAAAVRYGTPKSVSLLLKYGAKDKDGPLSAVSEATRSQDTEKLDILLKNGQSSCSAILDIIEGGKKNEYETLKLMMSNGHNPNELCSRYFPIEDIVQESATMWKVGRDIKLGREIKLTLLEWAKIFGDNEVIKIVSGAGKGAIHNELYRLLSKANDDLNNVYKTLFVSLNKDTRQKLKNEQRQWIKERDIKCNVNKNIKDMRDWLEAVATDEQCAKCVQEETETRTNQLASKLTSYIVSPREKIEGLNPPDLIKVYWHWLKSFPKGQEPLNSKADSLCGQKLSDSVLFLAGSNNKGTISRNCEVPANSYIFIPVSLNLVEDNTKQNKQCIRMKNILEKTARGIEDINGIIDSIEKDKFGIRIITMIQGELMLQKSLINVNDIRVEIDKKQIPKYFIKQQSTECFELKKTDTTSLAMSDGYFILLKPLSPGLHTINFEGHNKLNNFSQNIQYILTVK